MKIGWIGIGLMGSCMSKRLLDAGYELWVCDPDSSAEAASAIEEKGGHFVRSTVPEVRNLQKTELWESWFPEKKKSAMPYFPFLTS